MAAPQVIATYAITLSEDKVWLGWPGKNGATHPNLLETLSDADGDKLQVVAVNGQPMPQNDWRIVTEVTAAINGIETVIGELHVGRGGQVNFQRTADLDQLAAGKALTAEVSVKISDGTTETEQTITIVVTGENDAPERIAAYTAAMSAGTTWLKWDGQDGTSHENLLTTVRDVDGDALRVVRVDGIDMPDNGWRVIREVSTKIDGVDTLIGELHVGRAGQINFQRLADLSFLSEGEALDVSAEVTVADAHGGQTNQTVTIRLVGENDAPVVKAPYTISMSEAATWLGWSGASGTSHGNLLATLNDADGDRLTVTQVNGLAMPQNDWRVITPVTADLNGIETVIGELHVGRSGQVNFQRTADLDLLGKGEVLNTSIDVTVADTHGAEVIQTIDIEIAGERDGTSGIIAVEAPIKETWRTGAFEYSLPTNMDPADYESYVAAFHAANPTVNTIRIPVNAKIFGSQYEDAFWQLTDAYANAGYKLYFMYHDGELMDGWRDDAAEKLGGSQSIPVAFDLTGRHSQKIGSLDAPGELFTGWMTVLDALTRPENKHLVDAMYGLEFINEPAAYDTSSTTEMAWYAQDAVNFYRLVKQYVDAGALPLMPKILIDGTDYAQGTSIDKATIVDPATGIATDGLSYVRETIPSDVLIWSMHVYPGWQSTDLDVFKSWISDAADDAILITETHLHNARVFTGEKENRDMDFIFELETFARSSLDMGLTWWTGTGASSSNTFQYTQVAGSNDPAIVDGEPEPSGYWPEFSNFEDNETFVLTPRYASMTALLNYDFVANHLNDGTVRAGAADGVEEAAIFGSRFDDTLIGNLDVNILLGGLGNDRITIARGQGYLLGHEGDDIMTGGAERDLLAGGQGNDTMIGKGGDDWFVGGDGDDTINGGGGVDTAVYSLSDKGLYVSLWENIADDRAGNVDRLTNIENVVGSHLDDVLRGNWQANKLSGGAGNDTLYAGDGHDLLEGGSGKDIFVLQPHSGTDTVTDFEIGQDVLEIRGGAQTFAALEIRQSNDGAVIFYHEDNQLILLGIDATKLTEAAFSFL